MNIQITSRHQKVSAGVQDFIKGELEDLGKYYDKITSCHAILDKEHGEDFVEITCSILGKKIVGKGSGENLGKAVDVALEKVIRQLKKKKEIVKNHKGIKVEESIEEEEE